MKKLKLILLLSVLFLVSCNTNEDDDMKIVSLIPSNTEIINELMGTDQLVGITDVDNYPESLIDSDIEKINTFDFDPETLIALNPTHIVSHESVNTESQQKIDQVVEATGAELVVIKDASNLDDVYTSINEIGEFLNAENQSTKLVEDMKAQYEQLVNDYSNHHKKSLFVMVSPSPDLYVAGNNAFMTSMFRDLNIENVFDDIEGYPMVDIEEIINREPEYLLSAMELTKEDVHSMIEDTKEFKDMPFTEEDKQCVPNTDIISRPGPRIIEGMKQVAECVHD